jgi:hypothetical protein
MIELRWLKRVDETVLQYRFAMRTNERTGPIAFMTNTPYEFVGDWSEWRDVPIQEL